MDDFLKSDEFTQFILKQYLTCDDMTNLEKLERVGSSYDDFLMALESFKINGRAIMIN